MINPEPKTPLWTLTRGEHHAGWWRRFPWRAVCITLALALAILGAALMAAGW